MQHRRRGERTRSVMHQNEINIVWEHRERKRNRLLTGCPACNNNKTRKIAGWNVINGNKCAFSINERVRHIVAAGTGLHEEGQSTKHIINVIRRRRHHDCINAMALRMRVDQSTDSEFEQ